MAVSDAGTEHFDLSAHVDDLQSAGRYTFTHADVDRALKSPAALSASLRRLKGRGRIVAPRRGFYVIVPTEYRPSGAQPPSWYIDDLMRFLGQPYYVGLLSAAAIHGASHEQPMVFQVLTDRPTRGALAGRTRIDFHISTLMDLTPTTRVQTETGAMTVSTPESTALDLVRFHESAGGWSNVATVLAEMAYRIDPEGLRAAAAARKTPEIQRLGYLLDRGGQQRLGDALLRVLASRRYRPVPLSTGVLAPSGAAVAPWRVIPNAEVLLES